MLVASNTFLHDEMVYTFGYEKEVMRDKGVFIKLLDAEWQRRTHDPQFRE